jgi:hypothetical protein
VWLRVEGAEAGYSDNFFDLLPEVATVVQVTTDSAMSADELRRRLRLKSVAHVTQNR